MAGHATTNSNFTGRGVRFIGEVIEIPGPAAPAISHLYDHDVAAADKPSIAVLPFQNMSGDPEQEYFVDGMVEEIATAIARSLAIRNRARFKLATRARPLT